MKKTERREVYIGKLEYGADLLEEITAICREKNIRLGRVQAIGAVKQARLSYYDQAKKEYQLYELDRHLEITNLTGNISLKDGEPMVHAHVTFANGGGRAYGGHLASGTIVFACECVIEVFDGPELVRGHDQTTGLSLWEI
ncbi:MAG: DNA-binding protein [Kiritimatiellales bacterium]|nr:DNA-binding protein [Kiritimatiellales bacterium]